MKTPLSFMATAHSLSATTRWMNQWNGVRGTQQDGAITDKGMIVVPLNGTLRNFRLRCLTNPSAASGVIAYTLVKNGVDTGIVLTAPLTAAHVANDTVSTLAVVAGDALTLKCLPSVAPVVAGVNICWSCELDSDDANVTMLHFGADAANSAANNSRFVPPCFTSGVYTTNERQIAMPRDGLLSHLYIKGVVGSTVATMDHIVRVNGIDTAIHALVDDDTSPFSFSDLVHNMAVERGDMVSIRSQGAGGVVPTCTRMAVGLRYTVDSG